MSNHSGKSYINRESIFIGEVLELKFPTVIISQSYKKVQHSQNHISYKNLVEPVSDSKQLFYEFRGRRNNRQKKISKWGIKDLEITSATILFGLCHSKTLSLLNPEFTSTSNRKLCKFKVIISNLIFDK